LSPDFTNAPDKFEKMPKMKKVIIPFDGDHFSIGAFDFAKRLNEMQPILLAGLFLPDITYPGAYGFTGKGIMEMPALVPFVERSQPEVAEKNITRFKELCIKHNIEHKVHEASIDFILPQLKKETRFADLMIIGSQLFYDYDTEDHKPSDFLGSMLHHSECPVLLLPEQYEFPDNTIIAYDGSESSVYAVKQFTYLLPEFTENSTLVVYADSGSSGNIPDLSYIEELSARHFSNLTFDKFEADATRYFESLILQKKACILVTGAYERSGFSRIFKKSFAEEIITEYKVPVFIAHR
jgi:nucleotide-binding universal stress UspA family protein